MSDKTATEQTRYNTLLAQHEALKSANHDAIAMLLAGHHTQALKDLQRGNRICAAIKHKAGAV